MNQEVTTIRPTDLDCPGCGRPAGSWCYRHGTVMPGSCAQRTRLTRAYNLARRRGAAAGDSIFDGNSTVEQARAFIKGAEEGDPTIMDLCPSPFSREKDAESISELFDLPKGAPHPSDDEIAEYESHFTYCWWDAAMTHARAILEGAE